ncbi:hypothetical protein HU719_016135 [Pseudomonas sp. SWRI107]|nr:hypothetical protein [Pseudomonas farsensis]MBV4532925.1 hypothetical protein [Pseudomonas farsensis]
MTIERLYRILASALRRPTPAAHQPHRFYLIDSQSLVARKTGEPCDD